MWFNSAGWWRTCRATNRSVLMPCRRGGLQRGRQLCGGLDSDRDLPPVSRVPRQHDLINGRHALFRRANGQVPRKHDGQPVHRSARTGGSHNLCADALARATGADVFAGCLADSGNSFHVMQNVYRSYSGYSSLTLIPPAFGGPAALGLAYNRGWDGDGCVGDACPVQ